MKFFQLIRYKNLLIIIATMILMRYFIIEPILLSYGLALQMPTGVFIMLVMATVLIAAGGYVINDYFDTRTDLVNKPGEVIVGQEVTRREAIAMHMVLSTLGIVLGLVVSFKVGRPVFSLLFFLTAGILWFYSTLYKRQLIVGNLVVSVLTGLIPLIPLVFELPLLGNFWEVIAVYQLDLHQLVYWVGGYATMAFLLTFVREIIKDIEDFEGDFTYGRNTIPVRYGIKTAKVTAASMLGITMLALVYLFAAYMRQLSTGEFDFVTFSYFFLFIVVPCFVLLVMILLAQEKKDYHRASGFCKLIMLFGLLYAFIFRWFIV
ncbi:MAG TPA: geranylgeranylglycerol-phosphate geranylgeranyltransferase [Tenuifilaceae bacterium]|nr:geranylgeranylglycerol-phosphate geranylgeranyltransferase [Tenuifilaceae bacterium]